MEVLAGGEPGLEVTLDHAGPGIAGRENDDEIGIDDDRHLQRRSTLEVLAPLPDKLDCVYGSSIR